MTFESFTSFFIEFRFIPAEAMGAGRSKKEAKHQAARNLIDKLTGIQISDQILPPPASANGDAK